MKAVLYARVSTDEQAEKGYSIPDQLRELRAHAHKEGYEIIDEIVDDGYSGTDPRRPGLARVMELAGSRSIDIVIALKRNRFYRSRLYRLLMDQDLEAYGVRLVALDDTGNRFGDAMTDEFAEWYREEVTENTRRGKLEKAKQGKVLPSRYPPYGFRYDKDAATYVVDPGKMENVKRLFHLIGTESKSMTAVKKAFEDEGIVSPGGAKYWSISTIRRLIDNDVYLARPYEEVKALVSPEVINQLDTAKRYSIYWFNRKRVKRLHAGEKMYAITPNDPSERIAIPIEDPSIPPECVLAARENVEGGVKWSSAGGREWELRSVLRCQCGRSMIAYTTHRRGKVVPYYVCHEQRERHSPEEHAGYHPAEQTEQRVRQLILDLVRDPEVMMKHVHEDIERERERLNNAARERATWIEELGKVATRRDRFIEMLADSDITKEEFREKVAALDARKAAAERELEPLEHIAERKKGLDSLPDLVEEYIYELPNLLHGEIHIRLTLRRKSSKSSGKSIGRRLSKKAALPSS